MRYALKVEYSGAAYSGWQSQNNSDTVQQVLQRALRQVLDHDVKVYGSGRTDRGVHAKGQVCHFDTPRRLKTGSFPMGVNLHLPPDISVTACAAVADGFDARYDAQKKTYEYKAYFSSYRHPLSDADHAQYYKMPDVAKMRRASQDLVGKHDFRCFMASGASVKSTVREIYRLDIFENGDELRWEVEGSAFLYHMVRILVGTLLDVGYGKIAADAMPSLLQAGDRKRCGKTAPARGLCLKQVMYSEDLFAEHRGSVTQPHRTSEEL